MATWKEIQQRLDPLNLNKQTIIYDPKDPYQMPLITKETHEHINLKPFHTKPDPNKYAHFFLDDYQFERIWNKPKKYINKAKQYKGMLTPDFSLYTDYPISVQIWNTYRNRWLGQYWQTQNITVLPTIVWSTPESYPFCFKGIETGSDVAISSIGIMKDKHAKQLFLQGYTEMKHQIQPERIYLYGYKCPVEIKDEVTFIKNGRFE